MSQPFDLTRALMRQPILCPVQQRAMEATPVANNVQASNIEVEKLEREVHELFLLVNGATNDLPEEDRPAFIKRLWPDVIRAENLLVSARKRQQKAKACAGVWPELGRAA